MYSSDFQIIAITETWLKDYILNNEILPTGYVIYRNDRQSRGGGVMLAIDNNITSRLIECHNILEAITVLVSLYSKEIVICLLYIPPDADQVYHSILLTYLFTLSSYDHLMILGDFNLHDIDWDNYQGQSDFSCHFCDMMFDMNLEQSVNKPTHIKGNILDVILTNFDIDQPTVLDSCPPGLSSDHFMVTFNVSKWANTVEPHVSYLTYDYYKADWEGLYAFVQHYNFDDEYYKSDNIEIVWNILKEILKDAIDNFVPQFTIRKKQYPKWFTPTIKHHLNCVHSLRRKYKKHPTNNNKHKLQDAENELQLLMAEAKSNFESNLIHNFANRNNHLIFKYISSLTKSEYFPRCMYLGSDEATCDESKASLFNNYFYSVFTRSPHSEINESTTEDSSDDTLLNNISITPTDVYEALSSLDPNKAMGPDGISPKVLKYCADILTNPITYLFSLTLTKSYLPIEWRTHCIIPVFKTGDHTVISNYRPISLLCIISKVIEKIIFKETTQFVSNSFTPHQFGFLPGRSTLQQLLLFINELLDAKENNKMSDVIYLDFKKAFDSVSHCKLLLKLRSCGIAGKLFNWFKAYLTNRHQYVRINDSCSESLPVLSGVPQGSILGPLFFCPFHQ